MSDTNLTQSGDLKLNHLSENVKIVVWALLIMVGGMIFAFGNIVLDHYAKKEATYQQLVDKVNEQNIKIDLMLGQKVDLIYTNSK